LITLTQNYGTSNLGVTVSYGSDFNGFIDQHTPNATFEDPRMRSHGFAHMGMMGSMTKELRKRVIDGGKAMDRSAEAFVKFWERTLDTNRIVPLPTDGFKSGNSNFTSLNGVFRVDL
jgi:hypothetical protein